MAEITANHATDTQATTAEPSLHRVMGPWLLLLFIVGDILGTGIYALTGQVAKQVGGMVWLPFLVAFVVALMTAFSYLELVTKYPRAAGAALYTHRAFGIHFVTFIVAFAVMCSGITSASTASRAFAANTAHVFGLNLAGGIGITIIGLAFMALVAIVNFRGVGESVKANVVLTLVELTGLLIVIFIGLWAIGAGQGDVSRAFQFKAGSDAMFIWPVIAATTLAFFAMVGFEDSVNMAEETKDPTNTFPKILLTGLFITGVIYVLVSVSAITLVTPEELGTGETPLLKVVQAGAPNFPIGIFGFITMFAVANSALINMLMASRLVYGMSREHVLPPVLGKVHASAAHALCRHRLHHAAGVCADHLRRRGAGARRHHRAAAALRVHGGQYRGAGAAQGHGEAQALPHADLACGRRRDLLRVPGRAVDRPRSGAIQDRRHPDRHRRGAVGDHGADQPRPGREARGSDRGRHRRRGAGELSAAVIPGHAQRGMPRGFKAALHKPLSE